MEINYDMIIKYLVPKKITEIVQKNTQFTTQKNILRYAKDFPDKFKNLLNETFYRYGVTVHDNENNNISFWTSLLTLLDKQFIISYENDEISTINKIKNQFIDLYKKSELSNLIKDLDKNDIKERLKLEPDSFVLQYIVDILDVNLIILDFTTVDISYIYKDTILNPWKQTLLFAKSHNNWEPIMCTKIKGINKRYFDINDIYIKKILQFKDIPIHQNILDIIILEKNKIFKNNNDDKLNSIFITQDNTIDTNILNKPKLTKMKVKELYDLSEVLKLNMKKKSTKLELINSILLKVSTETNDLPKL